MLSGSWDNTLRLWDLDASAELRRFDGHNGAITAIEILPDGRSVLSGSWDNTLRLWDLDTGVELRRFDGHEDRVLAIAVLVGGRCALSGSADKTLRLWKLDSGAVIETFKFDDAISVIAASADESRAIVGDERGHRIVLNVLSGIPPLGANRQ